MSQIRNSNIKTFKDNKKYFKFVNRDDIVILDVVYTSNRTIKVRWCKKIDIPMKKKEVVK